MTIVGWPCLDDVDVDDDDVDALDLDETDSQERRRRSHTLYDANTAFQPQQPKDRSQ